MKKTLLFAALLAVLISCKKDKKTPEERLKNKIADIIPQKYIDTLTKLGIIIDNGTTPPNVEGFYEINPYKLKASNIPGDPVGSNFSNVKLKFFSQNSNDFGIQLISKFLLAQNDTSTVTAISGSGNKFTVYGKVKATSGSNTAIFAVILTGEKDGNILKNVHCGLINIDNSNGGSGFIKEGQGRLFYDSDTNTGTTSPFRQIDNNLFTEKNGGASQ